MHDLEPNGPMDRILYVIKTYRGTKNRTIIIETVEAALALYGFDAASTAWSMNYNALWNYLFADEAAPLIEQMRKEGRLVDIDIDMRPSREELEDYVEEVFDAMPKILEMMAGGLPQHHPLDSMVPWMAKEMGRINKAYRRGHVTGRDVEDAASALKQKGPAIGMWAEQNRVDMSKTTLADALEAIKDFEVEGRANVPQGTVVYTFPDGWTIQQLKTQKELDVEGEIMQHCVAGYCRAVRAGEVIIYSLRNPVGRPHATIEWSPDYKSDAWSDAYFAIEKAHGVGAPRRVFDDPVAFLKSDFTKSGSFGQIQGKQNEMPIEKYRVRIQKFIDERFDGDPLGKLMVPLSGQKIRFAGRTLKDISFGDDMLFPDEAFGHADFSGATLVDCYFPSLDNVPFIDAELHRCQFEDDLWSCSFDGASIYDCAFRNMKQCSFEGALFDSSNLGGRGTLNGGMGWCNFKGVKFYMVQIGSADFFQCELDMAQMERVVMTHVNIDGSSMDGFEFVGDAVLSQVSIENLDLTDVGDHTAMIFKQQAQDQGRVEWPDLSHYGEVAN
jgi:uncharacterized protein YjbI with pentapeptide repeats